MKAVYIKRLFNARTVLPIASLQMAILDLLSNYTKFEQSCAVTMLQFKPLILRTQILVKCINSLLRLYQFPRIQHLQLLIS